MRAPNPPVWAGQYSRQGGFHRRCSWQLGTASAAAGRPRQQRRRTSGSAKANARPSRWAEEPVGKGSPCWQWTEGHGGTPDGCHWVCAPTRGWFAAGIARRGHRRRRCDDRGVPGAACRPAARARAGARPSRSPERLPSPRVASGRRAEPANRTLVAIADEIRELTTRIGSVIVNWIPSEANGAAHALVADALARAAARTEPGRP